VDLLENIGEVISFLQSTQANRMIISSPKQKSTPYKKITITMKHVKDTQMYQSEKFTATQVFHENFPCEKLADKLSIFIKDYRQIDAFCDDKVYTIKISKSGKIFCGEGKIVSQSADKKSQTHNREKNYLLKEGTIIEPLIDLGVFTKEGKVVNSMYDKYKQINRFIEMVEDVLPKDQTDITIIDFGCGKSYLTFILYYYLVKVKGMKAHIIGLDLKEDVIAHCNVTAKKYGYDGLEFFVGDIAGFSFENQVDMVITLHACDTATDYALFHALRWKSPLILSVPCCQHECNSQIQTNNLSILTKYGIIKERTAALMTDALRCSLLEACGYRTQILEFIDIAHSPKNMLIRAKRANVSLEKRASSLLEVKNLMEEFNLDPMLYRLLAENKMLINHNV